MSKDRIEVSLSEIFRASNSLQRFNNEVKLPIKIAYRIQKLMRKLQSKMDAYRKNVNDRREELLKEFGVEDKDKDGKPIPDTKILPKEKEEEYQKEINEGLQDTVEVIEERIPLSLFEGLEIKITVGDLMACWFLFKDDTEPTEE